MGFSHVTFFVAAAIFRTLRSLSFVIGNQNNTSPTKNNGIKIKKDTLALDPYLPSSKLLIPLKSSENLPIWFLLIRLFTSNVTSYVIPLRTLGPVSVTFSPARDPSATPGLDACVLFQILGRINSCNLPTLPHPNRTRPVEQHARLSPVSFLYLLYN